LSILFHSRPMSNYQTGSKNLIVSQDCNRSSNFWANRMASQLFCTRILVTPHSNFAQNKFSVMKKTILSAALLLIANFFVSAQTADEIIAKHIQAIGGENWKNVKSIKMQANITAEAAAGMAIQWTMVAVRDKAARMDVSVMGMTQSTAVNGDKGWANNPFAGKMDPEPMTADQVKSMITMTDIDGSVVGYKDKGYTVEYVGTEDVDGTEALKIKINKTDNKVEYCFYDPATYYEIKNIQVEEVDGKTVESATIYSNFKTQDNIVMAFTMQQANPMMGNSTISLTEVVFNPPVDEKIFEMPAKK